MVTRASDSAPTLAALAAPSLFSPPDRGYLPASPAPCQFIADIKIVFYRCIKYQIAVRNAHTIKAMIVCHPMRMPLLSLFLSLFGAVPTLDLHGFRVRHALDATREFLREQQAAGAPQVRIIYGKGRGTPGGLGVLRQAVPAWIEQNAGIWVDRFERDLDASGNDGAMRIWLRPPEDSPRG